MLKETSIHIIIHYDYKFIMKVRRVVGRTHNLSENTKIIYHILTKMKMIQEISRQKNKYKL